MKSSVLRRIVLFYPLLILLCGIGYAKIDNYQVDGDAVAFMDIADAIHTHNWNVVANGYWNPAYAGALFLGQVVAHPSRWNELQTFFWVNFFIFLGCIGATFFFVKSLQRVRAQFIEQTESLPAFSDTALLLTSFALLFASFVRELSLGKVRSDALLLFFLLLAASFLLRLQSTGRFVFYPLLGLALGLAYLTKSFAFLPSGILLAALFVFGLTRKSPRRNRIVAGVVLAGVVFAAVAGPYIFAISKQRARLTTGESARLNYCFFVDSTSRWHEWHSGELGHATADFKHHEELLSDGPPVYSYEQHAVGTYPLWFDPAYWTDTLKPKVYLKGHIARLVRTSGEAVRFVLGHPEPFIIFLVLVLCGCFIDRRRSGWLPLFPIALWGLLMLGIYFPIDLQDRYLTAPFLFIVIPPLAMLRRPKAGFQGEIANGIALLFALLIVVFALNDLSARRSVYVVTGIPRGAYDKNVYPAAKGLNELGVEPGAKVACFGIQTCYIDQYWARLAGTQILAEIETKGRTDPGVTWNGIGTQDKQQIVTELRARDVKAIVAVFAESDHIPEGWKQLGTSNYFAYQL